MPEFTPVLECPAGYVYDRVDRACVHHDVAEARYYGLRCSYAPSVAGQGVPPTPPMSPRWQTPRFNWLR